MLFNNYSPQVLRDAIEYELQKTNDAKMAAITAMQKLNEDPLHYEKFGIMSKAKYKIKNKFFKRIK